MKVCYTCKIEKEIKEYHIRTKSGKPYSYCKLCSKKRNRKNKYIPIVDEYNETWKDIEGYEGVYQVSNTGRIKSLERIINNKKVLSRLKIQRQNHRGHLMVDLQKNKSGKTLLVSRLVAKAFIPNPNNYPDVDHIIENKDKTNNRVENLQWITKRANTTKYYKNKNPNKIIGVRYLYGNYRCELRMDGKSICVSGFDTAEEAEKMYLELINDKEKALSYYKVERPDKGLYFSKRANKWVAYSSEPKVYLGYFSEKEDARKAINKQNELNKI